MNNAKQIMELYDGIADRYEGRWQGYLKSTNDVALALASPSLDDRILDASGGTGMLAEQIVNANDGINIVLTDMSEGMLNIAKQRLNGNNQVSIARGDSHNLPFREDYFTKVLCINAMHHYHDARKALSEFYRVLRPNGSVIIVDWCQNPFHFVLFDFLMRSRPTYSQTYRTDQIEALLNEVGFEIENVITSHYYLYPLMGIKSTKNDTLPK